MFVSSLALFRLLQWTTSDLVGGGTARGSDLLKEPQHCTKGQETVQLHSLH